MGEPGVIKRLDQVVVNRIAAGEVIQRPANALKELIENSLDAKSTTIHITVKNGGMKLLQIQDTGTGIRKDDFQIVCERFTTSKLREYEDLRSISTYGFRGEALASISHVAHLTIVSKTSDSKCAYSAVYEDGKVKGDVKPTAGNQGTIITVEDLFYNMNVRKSVLKSANEEYQKISDIVGKYAIHNAAVGFSLKKFGSNNDIKTPQNSNCVNNIRTVYGNDIARELIEVGFDDKDFGLAVTGYVSNVNYSKKNFIFLLFINHRLVDSYNIRKHIDEVYTNYLPKGCHPFVYLSLEIDPQNVDVNVHPTKHEVHFLYEEKVVEKIVKELERKLLGANSSRTFYTQAKLPCFNPATNAEEKNANTSTKKDAKEKQTYDKDLVRTDAAEQKLDKFFAKPNSQEAGPSKEVTVDKPKERDAGKKQSITSTPPMQKQSQLTSVLYLCKEVEDNVHREIREIFAQHVFVGAVDKTRSLIQHNTKLYMCNTRKLMEELFYQIFLFNFGNFGAIEFTQPFSVYELALSGLSDPESGWTESDGPKEELAARVVEILQAKSAMSEEYFSVRIENGKLCSLPILLEDYVPDMGSLPMYVLRLATEVEWDEEMECFRTFARETAEFYSILCSDSDGDDGEVNGKHWKYVTEHMFYSGLKKFLLPPKSFATNGSMLEVANLPSLYKVFERC